MLTMEAVIVVGAGCFGAWTAYHLAQSGHAVILLDAYGPGNSRASSGGETRVIRMGYGAQEIYTRWSWRSLELWKILFKRADPTLFRETGVLWMAREQDLLTASTLATLERVGVPHERLMATPATQGVPRFCPATSFTVTMLRP
jgi:sarcosine oxidase